MATIGIDIDETVYSFSDAIRDVFFNLAEERKDKSILRLAYSNNLEWRNLVDHDKKIAYEAIERVHENTSYYVPFEGCVKTLNKIYASGHEILYVGSRKQKHHSATEDFLYTHDFPAGTLICADPQKPKNEYLGKCKYLIDDRPKTIVEFLKEDSFYGERKAFGLWRSYNQNLTDLDNLYLAPTWYSLEYYLKRKGVLS